MSIAKPQSLNLIDTISTGYRVLNRRLWVLLIPIALDLYLWWGARLSLAPFLDNLRAVLGRAAMLFTTDAREQAQWVASIQHADMRSMLAWLNFVPVLLPELLTQTEASTAVWYVRGLLGVVVAVLVVNLLALLCSSLFLNLIAGALRNDQFRLKALGWAVLVAAGAIAGYVLVLLGISTLLGLPFLVLSVVLVATLPALAPLIGLGWYVVLFWVYIYTGFAVEAIMLSRVGPLQAIYNSVNLVRRNLMSTLGLLLISFIVVAGLNVIWRSMATSTWGLTLAIVASAYVSSGLVAARLVFYRERMARWQEA